MRPRVVSNEVGGVPGMNWRPASDPDVAHKTYQDFAVPFNGRSRG
ncbi:MAG TPA: hypothetical protein VMF57_16960 [Solirubrobacteraceae bacterium]|nr:hypothetical protein [Solirubrobacteraceae bacterium]